MLKIRSISFIHSANASTLLKSNTEKPVSLRKSKFATARYCIRKSTRHKTPARLTL